MASFHNVTNEKSSVFEDADYDPDLEARLYAEIYYSNENYQQDYNTTDNNTENLATSLTSTSSVAAPCNKDNFVIDTNRSQAFHKSYDQRAIYPSRCGVLGAGSKYTRSDLGNQSLGPKHGKRQRLLAHKDLWLTRVQPEAQRHFGAPALQNSDNLSLETCLNETETVAAAERRAKENSNFSTPFGSRSVDNSNNAAVVNHSGETGSFPTQFVGGSINRENISTVSNRPNVGDNFSIQLRSGTTVNRSNKTQNINRQFGGGATHSDNFATFSNLNEAGNDCLPLESRSIEVENIRPAGNRFNEARNFSTRFRSGTIDNRNISPVLNHCDFASPQFGRNKANRNSRTIVTRSKTAGKRKSRVDTTERFVADLIEADFEAENLFSSYLAHQVRNFGQGSENELTNLYENAEVTDDIVARDYSRLLRENPQPRSLARSERKRELATRRRAERRRKRNELKRRSEYLNNADVTMDGKYKVISKKNKLKMKEIEPEPVDISSDSDDSILEVPVPPKTPPPVIQLQDSDDDLDDDTEKLSKALSKKGRKTNSDESSSTTQSDENDSSKDEESSAAPISENSSRVSREAARKTKNTDNSLATTNIQQECEDDSGKSSKSRTRKGKKSAEDNRDEAVASLVLETDSSAEPSAEPIAEFSSTIPQRISRETPKKTRNAENSAATSNIQECEDDSGRSSKNRPRKGKKSAEENRDESAASCVSETDSPVESSAEPIAESSSTIPQRISRETPKKTKNSENSVATSNIQECEDDAGKSSKNRPKKGKKSAEEPREEPAVSRISETDPSAESSAEPVAKSATTIPQRISRDTPKKMKNVQSSVSASNEQECEDDSGKSSKSRTKKGKKSAEEPREEIATSKILESSSNDNESAAVAIRETKLQKILKDAKKSRDTEISAAVPNPEDGNLILNCMEIQKGASNLEEIRKMREAASLIHAQSDDSMTESEANNWVNIAAGQANSSRKDDEIYSTGSTIDGVNPALWDQLAQENRAATTDSSKEIEVRSADDFLPIQTASKSTEGDFNAPVTNPEAANLRKRQKASSPFKDFDVPAVPEKRVKTRQKTSREQTMTEYFFKPMSKELQAFYNNPWGGENLDVCDVQSRMPRNPNCWAILNADLQGPVSKRRRLCPRCKTDTHYGRRCPENAKLPSCYMCGDKGHTESRCPHTMCLTCGRKYATYRPTCGYCSHLHCAMCNGSGHTNVDCPDLWRRYHNTTTSTPPVIPKYASSIMKPAQNLSCCNCAKRGHDVTMCRQLRWSQHFPTPMYISSYTEGPMYEPSNILPTQQPPNKDLTDELPRQERYFDTEFDTDSNVQIPEISCNEILQETNNDLSIETIDIPDDSPTSEPQISLSQAQILFQAGQLDREKTLGWYKSQTRLDTMKNIELTGILSGNVKPTFLINWQKNLRFGVEIIHDNVAGTFIRINSATTRIFKEFEKVIFQWLSRTDAEKVYLVYETNPFEIRNELMHSVRKKLALLKTVLPVGLLLKKIYVTDKNMKQTVAKYANRQIKSKKNRRRKSSLTSQSGICGRRRCQLITSLYCGNYVEKGDILLQRFRCLAAERLRRFNSGKCLAIREYLQFVYVCNEIFTFHQTEELTKALEKACAIFLAENPMDSEMQNDILKFPKAEVFEDEDSTGKGLFLDNYIIAQIGKIKNKCAVNTLAESLPLLAKPAMNCGANIDPQLALEPRKLNEGFSTYSEQVSAANSEITTNEGTLNPGESSSGILMHSLGKKARKTYRRMAKAAIKAANTSNVPRLQKMAKALKTKMAKCTILTGEIDSLQREISIDLRKRRNINGKNLTLKKFGGTRKQRRIGREQEQKQRQSNQQSQQNGTYDDNPANVTFHGNL